MTTQDQTIADIARRLLNVNTLDTQSVDAKDFHSLAVWEITAALEAAYVAGVAAGADEYKRMIAHEERIERKYEARRKFTMTRLRRDLDNVFSTNTADQ